MPLSRKNKIILSIGTIILGWFLDAYAFSTKIGNPINTIFLLIGLILFFIGIILLIKTLISKKLENN
jgi:hypothetical protein